MKRTRSAGESPAAAMRGKALFAVGTALSFAIWQPDQAFAEELASPPAPPTPASDEDPRQIVVIGDRTIIAALKDVEVEQTYDPNRVASYAVSTVGELIDAVAQENGDEEPSLLINGEPVPDAGNLADLPVEAVARVEVLPRGAAERIGGPAGRRAYNIVLRNSVRSATFTASHQMATAGGHYSRGEALFTYIKGQERLNLALRASGSDMILEADRNVVPLAETAPYSVIGNIYPAFGLNVDPALSALVGQPVASVALPQGNTMPSLVSLIPGANRTHSSILGLARSLRGESRPYEVSLTGNKVLTPWLSLAIAGRLNWNDVTNLSGLPSARFQIPATNAFTPFTVPVILALSDPKRPLRSVSESAGSSLSATFNANLREWRATLLAKTEERSRINRSELIGSILGGSIPVASSVNPFDGSLAGLIPVRTRVSTSRTTTSQFAFDIEGPLLGLPAGKLRVHAGLGAAWVSLDANDETNGPRKFSRHEYLVKAGATIPLTGRNPDFLPGLGETELSVEAARVDLGRFGKLDRHALAINWSPMSWLRFSASEVKDARATPPELLAASTTITPNVPYFDPLSGTTSQVTLISGGGGNLQSETQRSRTLSLSASPASRYNLLLTADYVVNDLRNQFGALPSPSSAVVLAFPDRFVRDANGQLSLVDSRTINFDRQHNLLLRLGVNMTLPLSGGDAASGKAASGKRTTLQINLAETILLKSKTVIRPGLGQVDLLAGGAIGIGGSQQRLATDVGMALMRGGSGVRVNGTWRGRSYLRTGTVAVPDLLTFSPVAKLDARAIADLGALFPKTKLLQSSRLTLAVENIGNSRQSVANSFGLTPNAFQPAYRDPIGRTVSIEFRKVF